MTLVDEAKRLGARRIRTRLLFLCLLVPPAGIGFYYLSQVIPKISAAFLAAVLVVGFIGWIYYYVFLYTLLKHARSR